MKKIIRLMILTCGILIIHIFSYGSTAFVRGSRRTMQSPGNNLINLAAPSMSAINGQYLPINSNDSLQPMQNYQFKNQAIPFNTIKTQQQSFSTQSDSQNLSKIPSEIERVSYFKKLNKGNLSDEEIAKLVEDTKYFSYKDLHNVSNHAQKSLLLQPDMPFFFCLIMPITTFNFQEMDESEKIDWLHRLLDDQPGLINFPLIERLSSIFNSRNEYISMISAAQKNAGNKPLDTLSIRQAILDLELGKKKFMRDKSETNYKIHEGHQEIVIHYEKGRLRSVALHEASHALAQIESSIPYFMSTLTIEPRSGMDGFMYANQSYKNVTLGSQSNQQKLQFIIVKLAGTVGEQIFDTYRYQGYSHDMLVDKDDIYTFLSSRIGANADFAKAKEIATHIAFDEGFRGQGLDKKIKAIIADCYMQTYELISKNKDVIEKLADAAMEKGTLHEDEIYAIFDKARPLHDFEHGAMTKSESAAFSQYRFPDQAIGPKITNLIEALPQNNIVPDVIKYKFGYDGQGNYIGREGYRDKQGNLFEVD